MSRYSPYLGISQYSPLCFGRKPNQSPLDELIASGGAGAKRLFEQSRFFYIGHGIEGRVFNIPTLPGYVLKIPQKTWHRVFQPGFKWPAFKKVKNIYSELNVGAVVAESEVAQIIKKIDGMSSGIPYDTIPRRPGKTGDIDWAKDNFYRKAWQISQEHLLRLNRMPQKSFDDLAKMLLEINRRGGVVDAGGTNNLMVDVTRKRFGIIDLSKPAIAEKHQCHGNHLAGMAGMLLDNGYVIDQSAKMPGIRQYSLRDPQFIPLRRQILKKALIAAQKTGLDSRRNPYTDGIFQYVYDLWRTLDICELSPQRTWPLIEKNWHLHPKKFELFVNELFRNQPMKISRTA